MAEEATGEEEKKEEGENGELNPEEEEEELPPPCKFKWLFINLTCLSQNYIMNIIKQLRPYSLFIYSRLGFNRVSIENWHFWKNACTKRWGQNRWSA